MYYVEFVDGDINCQSDFFEDIDDAYEWALSKGMIYNRNPENEKEFRVVQQ